MTTQEQIDEAKAWLTDIKDRFCSICFKPGYSEAGKHLGVILSALTAAEQELNEERTARANEWALALDRDKKREEAEQERDEAIKQRDNIDVERWNESARANRAEAERDALRAQVEAQKTVPRAMLDELRTWYSDDATWGDHPNGSTVESILAKHGYKVV